MRIIAVASGSSSHEFDVAVVDLAVGGGELVMDVVTSTSEPWPEGLREAVSAVLPPATTTVAAMCELDRPAHLVVSPGHKVFRDVRDDRCLGTVQLGQPAWILPARHRRRAGQPRRAPPRRPRPVGPRR